tara:strand:- start:370 stop:837 length:468 start_codon:yes stop_codon:yes gene_type:complete
MSEYRYSKWSDGNTRFKSKREAGKTMGQLKKPRKPNDEVDVSTYTNSQVNLVRVAEQGTLDELSKRHNIKQQHMQRTQEREQDMERKRVPGLIDFSTIHTEPSDKRSRVNERISNRYMVIQTSINPFLSTTDYIGDLKVQDTMLRPKDSNINESQ